ncbi:MAG TPA: DUF6629 family protein [Paracoccaceae bacterium]|nr:DUF6629 family protein [Paracoccaceae bacterium]
MCFSATVSFAAAGVLVVAGGAALHRARRLRLGAGMTAFAAFPLLFGVQQGIEGLVWLVVDGVLPPVWEPWTTAAFLFFALFLWPVAGPVVGWMLETGPGRRHAFAAVAAAGVALGIYLFGKALANPVPPSAGAAYGGHLLYLFGLRFPLGIEFFYFLVAGAAMVGSSNPDARLFGWGLAVSFLATALLWDPAVLPSVWCFFAAICSLIAVRAVARADRRRGGVPAP